MGEALRWKRFQIISVQWQKVPWHYPSSRSIVCQAWKQSTALPKHPCCTVFCFFWWVQFVCLLGLNSNQNFKNKQTMLRYNHVSCSWHSFFFFWGGPFSFTPSDEPCGEALAGQKGSGWVDSSSEDEVRCDSGGEMRKKAWEEVAVEQWVVQMSMRQCLGVSEGSDVV